MSAITKKKQIFVVRSEAYDDDDDVVALHDASWTAHEKSFLLASRSFLYSSGNLHTAGNDKMRESNLYLFKYEEVCFAFPPTDQIVCLLSKFNFVTF